jgi:molybdenum cofactor biosynthesis protein A
MFDSKIQSPVSGLTDQFGRVHDYLRISLTERCNLRCFYCMPPEGLMLRPRSEFMKTEEVIAIAKIFVSLGVKKIRLTGGEPLVRRDARKILKGLSALGVELTLTTNGVMVDEYIADFQGSGIKNINVSLDSLHKEKYAVISRRDHFDRVAANIDLLVAAGFHVKVNAVIVKGINDDEIADFVRWTRDKAVHVRFIEFMPFHGNDWMPAKCFSSKEIMSNIEKEFGGDIIRLDDSPNDTARNYSVRGHAGTFAIISSITHPFCDTCSRIRLTADGKLKNCLFAGSETDLLSTFRNGGDIRPLIRASIFSKKIARGGMENFAGPGTQKNRSMTTIGG